jgi:hypothetical protein
MVKKQIFPVYFCLYVFITMNVCENKDFGPENIVLKVCDAIVFMYFCMK